MSRDTIAREVLPNGLTVLVAEDHSNPVVASNLWVRAGYFDEDDSEVGIAHVIEHMFFKGTPDRPRPDQIATEVKTIGGELNAGTYYDSTNYYIVLPAENFKRGLEIQADALMHPLFDPEELKKELEAVIQEGRRKIDTPSAYAAEMLFREAFDAHRIRRWRIGEEEALRALTRDALLDYYRRHYVPGRVLLAVVGDVRAAEVFEAAHVYLGGMQAREAEMSPSPAEPPQTKFKTRRITGDIKRGYLTFGWHTPPVLTDDDLALRVAAHLLGAGRSSRLYQAVKEQAGLVDMIGASLESFRDIGILTLATEGDPKHHRAAALAIQAEVERLRREPPAHAEMERARAAIEFRHHQSRAEVLGRSTILAYYEAIGGYHLADEMVARLNKVNPDDVQRVAREYMTLANATLLEYLPEGAAGEPPSAWADDLARVPPAPTPPETIPVRTPAPLVAPPPPGVARVGDSRGVVRYRFDNGPVLLHEERRDLPLVTLCVLFRGGRSSEGRENAGITRLMQSAMLKGSTNRNARQVAFEMESLGSAIEKILDEDYFGFAFSILSRYLPRGFGILTDLVRRPAFNHEEIDRERQLLLAAQESIKDQSLPYTFQLFRQAAFGSHPYSLPSFGLAAPVQSTKRANLAAWHRAMIRPATMVVSIVGDVGAQEAIDLVAGASTDWLVEGFGSKDPGQLLGWGAAEVVETRRRRQTAQVIGFPTPGLQTPERLPLDLVQAGTSGLGGRFFEAVRGQRGLAYAVSAFNYHRVAGGAFAIYLATTPKDEAEARRVLFQEIARLRREGLSREEIQRAMSFVRGVHAVGMQGNGSRAFRYADAETRGLGFEMIQTYPERVEKVGYEEIQDAIWRYLDPDRCALGILRGDETRP